MNKKERDNRLMRATLENIQDMKIDLSDKATFTRDIEMIKDLVRTVLVVTDE